MNEGVRGPCSTHTPSRQPEATRACAQGGCAELCRGRRGFGQGVDAWLELPPLGRWAGSLPLDAGRSPVPKSRGRISRRPRSEILSPKKRLSGLFAEALRRALTARHHFLDGARFPCAAATSMVSIGGVAVNSHFRQPFLDRLSPALAGFFRARSPRAVQSTVVLSSGFAERPRQAPWNDLAPLGRGAFSCAGRTGNGRKVCLQQIWITVCFT